MRQLEQQKSSYIYNGSNNSVIRGYYWIIESIYYRKVDIEGYNEKDTSKSGVPIGSGLTTITILDE